jgi:hypothetical protein
VLPRFEIVHRARPVAVVAEERRTGFLAPFAAVEAELGTHDVAGRLDCALAAADGVLLSGWYDGGRRLAGLDVTDASGRTTHHRSRRHGRPDTPPDALAVALTGSWLSVLTRSDGEWTVRGKVKLPPRVDPRRPELLAGLTAGLTWSPREPDGATPVVSWRSGTFGQLGLRDVHLVTHADGTPVEVDGRLHLTMTHAGPGFADTAHCGVWSYDPATHDLRCTGRLFVRRGGLVLGDHATHLVRDGDRWLVASSTWGDFDRTSVAITLAESTEDLLSGEHVLDGRELPLPTAELPGRRVGTWDPHLTLIDDHWHLAFVTARKFFSFHPALARGRQPKGLDDFELVAAATDRTATEGTVLVRIHDEWRVLASDGADNPAPHRQEFPVFDLSLDKVGALDAPYPSNIPWPTLVERPDGWLLLTFDGTAYGGQLPGYGTHGDLIVMRTNASAPTSNSEATPGEGQP